MGLLEEKYNQLVKEFGATKVIRRIRDSYGVYALEIERPDKRRYLFAAKRNMEGTIVSVDHNLWLESKTYSKPIILAIGDSFYLFYPKNIECSKHYTNLRNDQFLMMNWDLKEAAGKNLRGLRSRQAITINHPILRILQEHLDFAT